MKTKEYYQEYRKRKRREIDYILSSAVTQAKLRASNKNLPFNIDADYVKQLAKDQEYKCSISGRLFDGEPSEYRVNPNTASLDRIIPELGYVKGNVRLVTWQVNCAVSEYGFEKFSELCRDVTEFNNKETNG